MILLEGEIAKQGLVSYDDKGDVLDVDIEGIAKAQAQRILEWGDEQCEGHTHPPLTFKELHRPRKRRRCDKCWAELRKELE